MAFRAIAMAMTVGSGGGFFFVALFAWHCAGFVECVRRVAIFAARRSGMKRCFALGFVVALNAGNHGRSFGLVRMRVVTRYAALALRVRMMGLDLRMAAAAGRGGVFLDIMRRMA